MITVAVEHIPMYSSEETKLILTETDENLDVTVPLVVYVGGVRHVIGEANVRGSRVSAILGDDISEELMDQIQLRPDVSQFSLGFSEGPNPYRPGWFLDKKVD